MQVSFFEIYVSSGAEWTDADSIALLLATIFYNKKDGDEGQY